MQISLPRRRGADRGPGSPAPVGAKGEGNFLVPIGIGVTLVGLLGDLLGHATNPHGHAQETLIVLGRGNNPWHIVLFLGILLTAVGGIRAMARSGSDGAALVSAWLSLLLIATLAVGGWVGWQAGRRANALSARESLASAAAGHSHAEPPAAQANAAAAGEGVEGAAQFGGHSHGVAGPTTAAAAKILNEQLAEAKTASSKFKDIGVAKADGYVQVTQFIPGLGLHLVNLGISQTTFDPSQPQVLLYEPTGTGRMRLVGIGYALETGDTPPAGFAGGSDVWHFHRDLCFLLDGSVTIAPSASACQAKSGIFQARTAWLLHVWLWKTNPDGVFTEVNPQVF